MGFRNTGAPLHMHTWEWKHRKSNPGWLLWVPSISLRRIKLEVGGWSSKSLLPFLDKRTWGS